MRNPRTTPRSGDDAIDVRVTPRAGRSAVAGWRDGVLLVRLAAAPVNGAANTELIALLSAFLEVPKRDITIVSGDKSRSKRVRVAGLSRDAVVARLASGA